MNLVVARKQFSVQKGTAKQRNISWEMTFKEWCEIWLESGQYHSRGRGRDNMVMCRKGDIGPYAIANVEIRSALSNKREAFALMRQSRGIGQIPEADSWLNRKDFDPEELDSWWDLI